MFDNPYAFIRYIVILIVIASVLYRFNFIVELFRSFRKKSNPPDDEIKDKVDELLRRSERNLKSKNENNNEIK
jgi:hypothetical protein